MDQGELGWGRNVGMGERGNRERILEFWVRGFVFLYFDFDFHLFHFYMDLFWDNLGWEGAQSSSRDISRYPRIPRDLLDEFLG